MSYIESEKQRIEDVIFRLRKRAEIRRQIPDRKSVKEGKPDRIADLLEESADTLNEVWLKLQDYRDLDCTLCK